MRDNFGVETVEAQIFGKVQRWYTDVGERFEIESTCSKNGGTNLSRPGEAHTA